MSTFPYGIYFLVVVAVLLGCLVIRALFNFFLAGRIDRLLIARGYRRFDFRDRLRIGEKLRDAVRRIPDSGVLNHFGYDGGSVDSLIDAFRKYDQYPLGMGRLRAGRPGDYLWTGYGNAGTLLLITHDVFIGGSFLPWLVGYVALGVFFYLYLQGLLRPLRALGYDWLDSSEAFFLRRMLGRRMRDIPPRDQLRVTPEFRDYDPASIVERMNAIVADTGGK